ncbi:MAG TPA: D-alanyl-D-alanine carboxypeptidase family protein, partial [Humibacter sp.]|nr:D-alanyl-D-alanine carboxypeptidase family protein [Humibacter sp.]
MTLGDARTRRAGATRGALLGGVLVALLVLTGCATGSISASSGTHRPTPHRSSSSPRPLRPTPTPSVPPTPTSIGFDKSAHSTTDPASPWVVVNKTRPLTPIDYAPADLTYPDVPNINHQPMRQETAAALVAMFQAGRSEAGLTFSVQSAYRSFESQTRVYDDDKAQHGEAFADTDTARPGHS